MHGLRTILFPTLVGCVLLTLPGHALPAQDDAAIATPPEATPDDDTETRIVRLQHVSAQELESTLRQFLQEDEQQRRRRWAAAGSAEVHTERGVTTRSHAATNSLILSGPPHRLDEVAELIASLDIETAVGSARLDAPGAPVFAEDARMLDSEAPDLIRVVTLKHFHAMNAVQNLRQLLGQNELRAVSLDGQSSIVLRGPAERVRVAVLLLEASDRAAGAARQADDGPGFEVFQVEHRDAQELQDRLRILFPTPADDRKGLRLCALADRIVARGPAAELAQVRALLAQLDAPAERDR